MARQRRLGSHRQFAGDDVHEAWTEERLTNRVAVELMPLLGYKRAFLGRDWWRQHTRDATWSRPGTDPRAQPSASAR